MNNRELLKIAKSYLGHGGAVFRKFCGLPAGSAYCNAYVDYIAYKGNVSKLYFNGKKYTYCPDSYNWCRKNLARVPLYLAMPMDVIYFDWDKNGRPNHIGFVESKRDTASIYTIEGNTDKKDKKGRTIARNVVAERTRDGCYVLGVFRPHFRGEYKLQKLTVDGECGYNTIASLQKLVGAGVDSILGLNTVRAIQRWAGVKDDGEWGKKTSLAIQTKLSKAGYYSGRLDSQFGKQSVAGLQRYLNAKLYATEKPAAKPKPEPKPPAAKPAATLKSRRIDIDLTNQIATVYGIYSDGSAKPIMSEFVSTARKGKTTPTGNFKIQGASGGRKAKLRTAKMSSGKSYAEFLCRFHGAKCMHTVPYKKRQTTGHVNKTEFNKLGKPASAGCVRMPWVLAHYIYNNCPVGTPVRVFKGKSGSYPMGKPKKYKATSDIDPTYKK